MRDIHKLCKICLNPGTRDIFDNGFSNIVSRDELNRIAEKLRFVTLLKVSPKENLPQQICDLCIVQLNVSYNFKRLALKNDFYIRQYMIENGMNLLKEDDDHQVENSIEIHQIHNVIRTSNRYRPQPAISSIQNEPFRRNSTTSSVSGISTMIVNGCENNGPITNGNSSDNQFVHPSRPFVQPIQIKTEPVDPDEENLENNGTNQTSPNSSSSESVLTINSSEKSLRTRAKTPPMIVINGHIENTPNNTNNQKTSQPTSSKTSTNTEKFSPKATTSVSSDKFKEKLRDKENEEPKKTKNLPTRANKVIKTKEKVRDNLRNLRTIKKPTNPIENKRKLREAAKKMVEKRNQQKKEANLKKIKKAIQMKIAKNQKVNKKKQQHGKQHKNVQKSQKVGKGKGKK